ncbi:hypothetical protein Tco_1211777 [Tanacetum coccineum]
MSNQTNELKNMMASFFQMNTAPSSGSGSLPSNTVANPRGDLKAITTQSGISYDRPPNPPFPKVVEREPEVTKDTVQLSTKNIQPLVVQTQALIDEPVVAPKPKPFIPYPSRANKQKLYHFERHVLLIDVFGGEELTLRVDDEAITFKVGQTSRYSYNDAVSINRIDVIDVACEEYAQEVLGFSDSSTSGNPTPSLDPILSTSSPSLTPFEEGDFILEEIEACLTNDSIPPGIDDDDFDPEGDLLLLEKLLNDDPSSPLPPKELHVEELKIVKSSIDDPPELELKDLPSHLEYAFLEGTDKLPVIIAKNLKEDEKVRLLKVLKSHKRAIAWKISDIKGIDPQFCTHKILMEDDSKPAIQHQRRVNPKIHEVIKKEVIKLLDAGLIYPISDSPWVSPVHCVPKKGGMTVIENEDNELIPTRLVMGWRVCIDYRKLNDATRKDHFPLPFMYQMLERLTGNIYYCFLDGFSGYFQIPIDPQDQERTTFTCSYGTFAYRRKALFFLAKQDAKQRLLWWILLLQEFDVIIRDKKGAENLTADHLSRLENPHQDVLENNEITETFPLETLGFCSGGGGGGSSVVVVSVFSVTLEGYISCATLNLKNTHPHRYDPFSIARAVVICVAAYLAHMHTANTRSDLLAEPFILGSGPELMRTGAIPSSKSSFEQPESRYRRMIYWHYPIVLVLLLALYPIARSGTVTLGEGALLFFLENFWACANGHILTIPDDNLV